MPDAISPDGNRVTLTRAGGHQIRLVTNPSAPGPRSVRVSCACQERRTAPWSTPSIDGKADHWALYNRLPHDPAAGPFTPVDEATGAELVGPRA